MKKFLLFIVISIICLSCGKKDRPEYQSQKHFDITINSKS